MNWHIAQVHNRREKNVCRALVDLKVEPYCPTTLVDRRNGKYYKKDGTTTQQTRKEREIRLPGYVLFRKPENLEFRAITRLSHVLGIVCTYDGEGRRVPYVMPEREVAVMRQFEVNEEARDYQPEDNLRICHGVYDGVEGIVSEVGEKRLKAWVTFLGERRLVPLERWQVEPA